MSNIIDSQANQDFEKAKNKALFSNILNILHPEKKELLSFYDIKSLVKPRAEMYRGMQVVKIDDIVGSEGRYQDFNKTYLPKKNHLKQRWVSVDKAYLKDIILPPIQLYKLGDAYFVRDGNHRVSVAKSQGHYCIDAEVVELTSEIPFRQGMTQSDVIVKVIEYERKRICSETKLDQMIDMNRISFTTPGRYDEMLRHILGHKYFMNQDIEEELTLEWAAVSWYKSIYLPIIDIIDEQSILSRFPGRSESDLYMWIVKHWDMLKNKYGKEYPLRQAVDEYSRQFGQGFLTQFLQLVKRIFKR